MTTYVLPAFNLQCNIVSAPATFIPFRLSGVLCALVYGRRTNVASSGGTGFRGVPYQGMNLLLPARTDIRGPQGISGPDNVEVPAGSGRWYSVDFVDDIGKGWPNEHRTATCRAIDGIWPEPYP